MSDQVLVVSADASRRARLMAAVQQAGDQALPAESGTVAASALAEPGLDAILLDLALPELDLAALRAALASGVAVTPESLEEVERRHIAAVLRHTGGNKRQAALLLGLARSTLLHKVRKYRIVTPRP